MKVFHCDHCDHLLFFENTQCVRCKQSVAYLPDLSIVGSLDKHDEEAGTWHSPRKGAEGHTYRLCRNYADEQVCNWAVLAEDANPFCVSCRLTHIIPNLTQPQHRQAWYRLEVAKRRLIYTLLQLRLPIVGREEDSESGLAFEFKTDANGDPVLTGHSTGIITINVAEADDVERERRRTLLHEPYRTLAGHFRHESGHYYWDRLVKDRAPLEEFRQAFGDERSDYDASLKTYYTDGAPTDWQDRYISAYASAHPLEDWAETWTHYLHMIDTVETAAACGVSLRPRRSDEPSLSRVPPFVVSPETPFERLIESWFPVTYMLNNFNRGLGLADAYPFVWSVPAIDKLRFVHQVVRDART